MENMRVTNGIQPKAPSAVQDQQRRVNSSGAEATLAETALKLIKPRVDLAVDALGQPRIHLPADPVKSGWPLAHHRVRSWIGNTVWEELDGLLSAADIDKILNVLEGGAWTTVAPEDDPRKWVALDQSPFLQALVALVQASDSPIICLTSELEKKLEKKASLWGIMPDKKWPKGPIAVGLRLTVSAQLLLQHGIEFESRHISGGTEVTLRREKPLTSDSSVDVSSSPVSQPKTQSHNNLERDDKMTAEGHGN